MTNEEYKVFVDAWNEAQSWEMGQEGTSAIDRGSFKSGFFAALRYVDKKRRKEKLDELTTLNQEMGLE